MKTAPLFEIEPRDCDVQARFECNGKNREAAVETLRSEIKNRLAKFKMVCPEVFEEIEADREKAASLAQKLSELVTSQSAILNQIESLLLERADLLQQRSVFEQQHRNAVAILSTTDCLNLTKPELAELTTKREHLPQRIAEFQSRADKIGAEIKRQAKAGRFDIDAVLKVLHAAAGRQGRSPYRVDDHICELIEAGFAKV